MDSRSYSQRSNASNANANAGTRVGILVHPPRSSSLAVSPSVSFSRQSPGLLSPGSPTPSEKSSSGNGRKLSNASSNYIANSNNSSNNISSNNHHYIPLSHQLFFFAALLDAQTVPLSTASTGGPITTAPILALYNAHAAQSLLNLSDESIARASAIGPLSLPNLVQDLKTVDLANSASSLFLATEPANSLLPIAALRLYHGGHESSVHVAEDGIFVLQVDGFDFDADVDDTWMIKLDSADAMMEWLRCLRDVIKTV
ncbi:hypothetical protein HK100_011371 [Physocladia obscura]|uniref:Uncharacterized protein n=1 Tax=Physocladia obscura TaxID=109957 RepID=A0AAD5T795_9FUNG|nr:hypothetical protein HK100_011371 [Physocladia obscura]